MANIIVEKIEQAITEAKGRLAAAAAESDVEAVRIHLVGRKGIIPAISKEMGSLAVEDRPAAGQAINAAKSAVQEMLAEARRKFEGGDTAAAAIDVTLPGRKRRHGHKHPICQTIDDCLAIFRRMGFIAADGPEIETVRNNFDALNTPSDHPSRDRLDTFYFADGRLLRTQTSPVQIRVMEEQPPPIRIVAPGRCFRRDTPDATHSMNFHQIEGLYIDRGVSLADLKACLLGFAHELFGEGCGIRLRPHFFPFTEPSVEVDFSCVMCGGEGCRICKHSGWLEIAGAGMVDPNVLSNVGIDPEEWSGYAFGFGVERIAMLRHRVADIRWLYENDQRFIEQF